jgi:murein DD-endopeptidase MepM/ murein hydrolase activator NlpD
MGVAPTSSVSAGVAAATASSGVQGAGVTSLADIVDPRRPFVMYETQPGDSVSSVAEKYGISIGTLLDNNPTVGDRDLIQKGQVLIVPLRDGILHKVASGETLAEIVDQYDNITLTDAINFRANAIADPDNLEPGSFVLLPDATRKPPPPPPPPPPTSSSGGSTPAEPYAGQGPAASGGKFSSPLLAYSAISDPFGVDRGYNRIHEGIDLDLYGFPHSPVFSACEGTVVRTEWLTYSYGYYVVVDCGEGFTTLYAHFSQIDVVEGQPVAQGAPLGYSGSTGFSTGEHLHFEIRFEGAPLNPTQYIGF